ncbi:MAG: MFS transporter [Syntrophobacteria bacterium]
MTSHRENNSAPTEPAFRARKVLIVSGGHFVHDVFSSFLAPFFLLASALLYVHLQGASFRPGRRSDATLGEIWGALSRIMIPVSGVMVCRAFMAASLVAFLPTFMVTSGKSLWLGGASLAVLELSGTVGTLSGGTLSDRVGRHAVLAVAVSVSSISMLGFVHASGWILFPCLLILGGTLFAASPVVLALVQDHCPTHRGAANGLYMGFNFLSMGFVTLLVGWLADIIGLKMAFTVSALIGLGAVPIVFLLPRLP